MEVAIPLIIVVVLALLVVAAMVARARRQGEHKQQVLESDVPTLRYRVPEGRDPAVVLAALHRDGFEALPDTEGSAGRHDVVIPCPGGVDRHREQVRAVIGSADAVNLDGDVGPVGAVRFTDE